MIYTIETLAKLASDYEASMNKPATADLEKLVNKLTKRVADLETAVEAAADFSTTAAKTAADQEARIKALEKKLAEQEQFMSIEKQAYDMLKSFGIFNKKEEEEEEDLSSDDDFDDFEEEDEEDVLDLIAEVENDILENLENKTALTATGTAYLKGQNEAVKLVFKKLREKL